MTVYILSCSIPNFKYFSVPCLILTDTFWPTCRIFRRQVRWYSHFLKNFPQFAVVHKMKSFGMSAKQRELFFWDPLAVSMIQWMLAIWSLVPQTSLYIWKFSLHVLLTLSLKNFASYLVSKWDEHNCMIGWTFFVIVFLLNWLKTDLFLHYGHCWVFKIADILNAAVL